MRKPPPPRNLEPWLTSPVVPVIWPTKPEAPLPTTAGMLFLQGGELAELPAVLEILGRGALANVPLVLHIDLLAGLSSDEAGLRYVAGLKRLSGIITVRSHLVAAARHLGLAAILRLFLQDGRSVSRGLHLIEQAHPDMVELIPGVAALEAASDFARVGVPHIAGGLVRTPELLRRIIAAGSRAVSTSDRELWKMNCA